jgi:hypothetical protein
LALRGIAWRIADQRFDTAVIATPSEQAGPLLEPWEADFAAKVARRRKLFYETAKKSRFLRILSRQEGNKGFQVGRKQINRVGRGHMGGEPIEPSRHNNHCAVHEILEPAR